MRLLFTHHAFVRLSDWHAEFAPFVPSEIKPLTRPQAQGVFMMLENILGGLGRGRPSTLTSRLNQERARKYQHHQHVYVFDRQTADFYQMVDDQRGLVMLTVTWLEKAERIRVLDELAPSKRVKDITEITVPYWLSAEAADQRFAAIDTPWAKKVPLIFGVPPGSGRTKGVDESGRFKRTDSIPKKGEA